MSRPPLPTISRRARKILHAVISEFLQTGEAVGSRTVTRRHGIGLSPATVRNVMADLEELGLLEQPHTSAGRIPTESGLRFFIDALLKVRSLSAKEKEAIRHRYAIERSDVDAIAQRTSRMLSEITAHAGIVSAPALSAQRFRRIEFVPLGGGKYLCILVTTDAGIENRLIQVDFALDAVRLERIHNYLNELLIGLTLDEMRRRVLSELGYEKNRYDQLVSSALRMSQAALDQPDRGTEIIVSGQANLLEAAKPFDSEELARIRDLFQALEDKEIVVCLLDKAMKGAGIQVFLGAETDHAALEAYSLVVTPYGPGDQPVGAVAVIGPLRMNYGKVMSIVDFAADLVSEMVAER